MSKIRRFKRDDELTVDELLAQRRARSRGEPEPKFETDEYRRAKAEALRKAGLETDDDPDRSPEELTVDELLERRRRMR